MRVIERPLPTSTPIALLIPLVIRAGDKSPSTTLPLTLLHLYPSARSLLVPPSPTIPLNFDPMGMMITPVTPPLQESATAILTKVFLHILTLQSAYKELLLF